MELYTPKPAPTKAEIIAAMNTRIGGNGIFAGLPIAYVAAHAPGFLHWLTSGFGPASSRAAALVVLKWTLDCRRRRIARAA
jgi:hypothetical protein